MQPLNRMERDLLPPAAYQTFSISTPHDQMVQAACQQVGCESWRNGWETLINEATELGQQQAAYIRARAGRTFREQRTGGGLTVFRFDSGQRCFANHQTRPELYAVRDGDYRGNPTGKARQHQRAADWVEDFGEHQLRLIDQQQKG